MNPIFAVIRKVDEETRTVTGRAAQECLDRDGEIFDYKSSKPNFQRWSAEVYADTNGKSYGNVRSMHSNVAAGKVTEIDFNDAEKAIDISVQVVDDNEWKKVQQGVMTGFSIGGSYVKKWTEAMNGKMVTRYTANPSEISLVDRPCIPTAKFYSVHKADGSVLRRQIGQPIKDPTITAIRKAHRSGRLPFGPGSLIARTPALELTKSGRVRFTKGLPPQSSNDGPFGLTAATGASNNWRDQSSPGSRAPLFNAPHSASIRVGRPPPTQTDETVEALKGIFAAGPKRGL